MIIRVCGCFLSKCVVFSIWVCGCCLSRYAGVVCVLYPSVRVLPIRVFSIWVCGCSLSGCTGVLDPGVRVFSIRLCGCSRSGCAGVLYPAVRVFSIRVCGCSLSGCAGVLDPGVRVFSIWVCGCSLSGCAGVLYLGVQVFSRVLSSSWHPQTKKRSLCFLLTQPLLFKPLQDMGDIATQKKVIVRRDGSLTSVPFILGKKGCQNIVLDQQKTTWQPSPTKFDSPLSNRRRGSVA
jgi:hypothetical protein